jgi:hypothetical protein
MAIVAPCDVLYYRQNNMALARCRLRGVLPILLKIFHLVKFCLNACFSDFTQCDAFTKVVKQPNWCPEARLMTWELFNL